MRKFLFLFYFCTLSILVFGQDIKYGKLTKDDFTKTASTISTDAAAEVLFSQGKYRISFNKQTGEPEQIKQVYTRIRIYDKDKTPNQILNISIPLYVTSGADRDKISGLKAATYNLENGKIVEQKVSKGDIFTEKTNKYLNKENFTFPNVKNGSIIEYSYEIYSPFFRETDTWYFQESIPVVKSSFTLEAHESLLYSIDLRGQYAPLKKETTFDDSTILNEQGSRDATSRPSSVSTYKSKINSQQYTIENLPSIERESYVLNPRNMLSSIRFELASYRPTNSAPQNFTTSWEKIAYNLMDSEKLGRELNGNGFLDETVKQLIADKPNDDAKITALFNYIQTNFTWNNFYGIYTDNGLRKTFNEKSGNVADINLLLVSMLRKAEIDANPVVLSSLYNGVINYSFPSQSKLNYLIAGVNLKNEIYLLDATDKNSKINLLPLRASNDRGFMLLNKGVKEIDLTNRFPSNSTRTINANLSTDGALSGTFTNTRDNYFYMADLNSIQENAKKFEEDFVENYNFETDEFKTLNNDKGLLRHSFKFDQLKTTVANNKIIFNPLLFLTTTKNSLTQEKRNYNIEFGTPMTESTTIKIKIPAGYKVESLPENKKFVMTDNVAAYTFAITEKDGYIIAQSQQAFVHAILPATYYTSLKQFLSNIVIAETQNIVLIKH